MDSKNWFTSIREREIMKQLLSIALLFVFIGCASFIRESVSIGKAGNLKYFSLGSHNRNSVGNRTDVGVSVPIEGVPVRLDAGGNGFLTAKNIRIDEVDSIEYFEVLSRNDDVKDLAGALKAIPEEFFEFQQFQGEREKQ